MGSENDGWAFPKAIAALVRPDWIAYGFGVSVDISYDVGLAEWFGIEVHTFDPTPSAIEHVANVQRALESAPNSAFSPRCTPQKDGCWASKEYWNRMTLSSTPHKIMHHQFALGGESSQLQFYLLRRSGHPDIYSLTKGIYGDSGFSVDALTIKDTMAKLGHAKINILKVDIEGEEPSALNKMLEDGIFPELVLVDYDSARRPNLYDLAVASVKKMQAGGYVVCMNHWWNIAYVHRSIAAKIGCARDCALGCESMGVNTGAIPRRKNTRVMNTKQTSSVK